MNTLSINNFSWLDLLPELFGASTQTKKQSEVITIASAINGISKFDLPYVYHHLYVGRRLSLKVNSGSVSVYYRAHKLGNLPYISSKRLLRLIEKGYDVQVKINKLKKVQYLPIDDIQISMDFQLKSKP